MVKLTSGNKKGDYLWLDLKEKTEKMEDFCMKNRPVSTAASNEKKRTATENEKIRQILPKKALSLRLTYFIK